MNSNWPHARCPLLHARIIKELDFFRYERVSFRSVGPTNQVSPLASSLKSSYKARNPAMRENFHLIIGAQ